MKNVWTLWRGCRGQAERPLRSPDSALSTLARTLGVSLEELGRVHRRGKKRGSAPKRQQQMERIQHLPRAQQRFVMQVIDTVLAHQDR